MTPKRIYLLLLGTAAISINCRKWNLPDIVTLVLTLAGTISLFVSPGLLLLGVSRRRARAQAVDLIWIAVAGPVALTAVALIAWLAGDIMRPALLCKGAAAALILSGLAWTSREPSDLRLSVSERKALLVFLLVTMVAAGRSVHSLGMQGELYGGTVTRTLEADGRSDARVPFIIPIDVANHWDPFAPESQAFYSPYTFTSRGPLVGLAATPAVLIWGLPMQTIGQMGEPFQPADRYGYMQYRFSIIVLGALAVLPFFVALGGGHLAVAGTAIYAMSPFLTHEVYFTWTKQATVPFILSAFCLVLVRRAALAGAGRLPTWRIRVRGTGVRPVAVAIQGELTGGVAPARCSSSAMCGHAVRSWRSAATAHAPAVVDSRRKPNPAGFATYVF